MTMYEGQEATQGTGSRIASRIAGQANTRLSGQKNRLMDGVGDVAEAIRQAGGQLRDRNPRLAEYADAAAARLDDWSRTLRERDAQQLLDDFRGFARRRPALVIGGGVALGLVLARFLKSSGHGQGHRYEPPAYQPPAYQPPAMPSNS